MEVTKAQERMKQEASNAGWRPFLAALDPELESARDRLSSQQYVLGSALTSLLRLRRYLALCHIPYAPDNPKHQRLMTAVYVILLPEALKPFSAPERCVLLAKVLPGRIFVVTDCCCCLQEPEPTQIGPHWLDIGFQGADPTTDVRGNGILNLLQMARFTLHNVDLARRIHRVGLIRRDLGLGLISH